MNKYEIAKRLRDMAYRQEKVLGFSSWSTEIRQVADELDPPRPEPGTVVWWRIARDQEYHAGLIGIEDDSVIDYDGTAFSLRDADWKPARILADDEVAVEAPCTDVWPKTVGQDDAVKAVLMWHFYDKHGGCFSQMSAKHGLLTRAEAEAREAGR